MKNIHEMISSVTAIIMAFVALKGTNIVINVIVKYKENGITVEKQMRNFTDEKSGYKTFDSYKVCEFIENGEVYTYSGSYTDVSINNSDLTATYYKYCYKSQK